MMSPLQFSGQFVVKVPAAFTYSQRQQLEHQLRYVPDLKDPIDVARENGDELTRVCDADAPVEHGKPHAAFLLLEASDSEDADIKKTLASAGIQPVDYLHVPLNDRVMTGKDLVTLREDLLPAAEDEAAFCDFADLFLKSEQTKRLYEGLENWQENGFHSKIQSKRKPAPSPLTDWDSPNTALYLSDLYRLLTRKS